MGGRVASVAGRHGFSVLSLVVASLSGCSSHGPKPPPQLGGCTPGEIRCSSPSAGGGGSPGEPSSGMTGSSGAAGDEGGLGGCGVADSLVSQNPACEQCIVTNCCQADQACGSACQSLLSCIVSTCTQGDTTCVLNCENMWPTGQQQGYTDLSNCLSQSASAAAQGCSSCPVLQQ